MVLNIAHFRKWIKNNWRLLNCGAGGGGRLILFNCVGSGEVLHIAKKEINSVHTINRRKCNLIGHILLRNCLIEHHIA